MALITGVLFALYSYQHNLLYHSGVVSLITQGHDSTDNVG